MRNQVLTSDRLSRLNIANDFSYVLCNQALETVDHLFLNCPFARDCWTFVLGKLDYSMALPLRVWDLFQAWPSLHPKSMFACIWICSPSLVLWAIWWECNKCIFRNSPSSLDSVLNRLHHSIVDVTNAYVCKFKGNRDFSSWDNIVSKRWEGLNFPVLPFPLCPKDKLQARAPVKWSHPQQGFIKLNLDGSSKGNPSNYGIGYVLHDHYGDVLCFEACPIAPTTNNFAEALALLQGLSTAKKFQIRHIHVEGDSSIIINACVRQSSFARHIHYVLVQICSLLDSFHEVFLTHVFFEGNSLADLLANYGSDNHSFSYPSDSVTLDTYLPIFCLIQSKSS